MSAIVRSLKGRGHGHGVAVGVTWVAVGTVVGLAVGESGCRRTYLLVINSIFRSYLRSQKRVSRGKEFPLLILYIEL